MATRSGKRIHSSLEYHEEPDLERDMLKSERKTRSKRGKDIESNTMNETAHFVRYPGHEVMSNDTNVVKSTRKLRRHTLKDQNNLTTSENTDDVDIEIIKHSRRTRKNNKESLTENDDVNLLVKEDTESKQKSKKNKKKKQKNSDEPVENCDEAIKENLPKTKKKSKKRKNLKQVGPLKIEDVGDADLKINVLNESNRTVDSYHSAAGSPQSAPNKKASVDTEIDVTAMVHKIEKTSLTPKPIKRKSSLAVDNLDDKCDISATAKTSRKSKRKNKSMDNVQNMSNVCNENQINLISEKTHNDSNGSVSKMIKTPEKSTALDGTFDKCEDKHNTSVESTKLTSSNDIMESDSKIQVDKPEHDLNNTFEIDLKSDGSIKLNGSDNIPYKDVENTVRRSSNRKKSIDTTNNSFCSRKSLNTTIDKGANIPKLSKTKSLDTTFDKSSSSYSKSTFDIVKNDSKAKADAVNLTFDKATNDSCISINSDDSKTENVMDTTPELVESSINESIIQKSPATNSVPVKEFPITPLKREGTYTKDSPKVETPKSKGSDSKLNRTKSLDMTPNRGKSLPSPGHTPFPASRSTEKNKVLNITHSIEKVQPRTSLVEPPRTTRVMFCSPVNNPSIASQIKRKVIKSNLKGSNKSFVFNESLSESRRNVSRKRSYTQSDADDAKSKRTRIGEEMQQSVDRLSRPRTVSAAAKLSEPSTPIKTATPTKVKGARTKLPNFAALHQKRFDKMESLDECQERKAKRARQLLTPTGSVNLLERVSPKEKVAESPKRAQPKEPKKHTLESLNPGYTRFGFKMNCDENPFATKRPEVSKERSNGLTRQATLPSLVGATSLRRENAKQVVMREKSFTEKRDVKRKENRTVIKGVRTNRRFELQMMMRNLR